MKFVKYENVEDFLNENLELILEKEWLNCLMVGNCYEGIKIGTQGWILAKVAEENKTELILLYRRPYKLLLYSPTDNETDTLYKFAAEEIYKIENNLAGVNSESKIAQKFSKYYCEVSNKEYKLTKPMKILTLEKIEEGKLLDDITFREARIEDKQILCKFIKDFNSEALKEEMSDEEAYNKFEKYMEKEYYVLEKDRKILSQAVIARDLKKGKCISGVYTPKEERKKGYAYNLVYRISQKFLEEGAKYCVLYTDAKNPISNHVYEKIGYRKRVECEEIEFF